MNESIITVKNMCPTDILKEDSATGGKFLILFDDDDDEI
jgi:tagatose-1,6-bisphosphate aldolase